MTKCLLIASKIIEIPLEPKKWQKWPGNLKMIEMTQVVETLKLTEKPLESKKWL